MRPETVPGYLIVEYPEYGGAVYQEPGFPSLAFAVDGSIYQFGDKKILVCGGAYSVDKHYRIAHGLSWWADEQPSEATKRFVEQSLKDNGPVDYLLTHTCPFRCMPTEAFLPMVDQSTVDNSTEQWLDTIYDMAPDAKWLCGHFHIDKADHNVRFMYHDIITLEMPSQT